MPQVQAPAASAQDDWDAVKTSNSEAAITAFIATHGDNKMYRALAEERLATLKSQQTQLPNPALPEEKPKKQDKNVAKPAPITKTKPVAKAEPNAKPSQGGRPDANKYARANNLQRKITNNRAVVETKFGTLVCNWRWGAGGANDGLTCFWR